jgi:hypothetical protein
MADYSITAASFQPSAYAEYDTGIAGATITAGQPVYKDASDSNKLKLADANLSLAASRVVGLAAHGAAAGQRLAFVKKDPKLVPGFTLTAGDIAILSATAGAIAPVADLATGHYPVVLGAANSTTEMNFAPVAGGVVK